MVPEGIKRGLNTFFRASGKLWGGGGGDLSKRFVISEDRYWATFEPNPGPLDFHAGTGRLRVLYYFPLRDQGGLYEEPWVPGISLSSGKKSSPVPRGLKKEDYPR